MERKGQENVALGPKGESTLPTKRPYNAPRLRRLGSVRELTLGQTMGPAGDGGGGMRPA